jgi:adenosylcobinamide hydrolase
VTPLLLRPTWHEVEGLTVLVWRPATPVRAATSAPLGGGLGERRWVLNTTVPGAYDHPDPAAHVARLATALGLDGDGVGMLTAVDVRGARWAADGGVEALVTVGLGWPTWAAAPDGAPNPYGDAGTINVLAVVPVALTDGALVNAVATATEAKAQALLEHGVPGTGTASDAVCVCATGDGPAERYGGPRSSWGSRLARAVHAAVRAGAAADGHRRRDRPR